MTFDEADYEFLWKAPEGCDYAVQYRRPDVREFQTYVMGMDLQRAQSVYNDMRGTMPQGSEIRLVTLSRYPPCAVTKVIKYLETT